MVREMPRLRRGERVERTVLDAVIVELDACIVSEDERGMECVSVRCCLKMWEGGSR